VSPTPSVSVGPIDSDVTILAPVEPSSGARTSANSVGFSCVPLSSQ
jgi:hypothetical protein